MKKIGKFFIGTSNITLPGPKATFPEAYQNTSRLHYYSSLFNSLEVNSTFYKLPLPRTLKKWSTEVDQNFRFTLKLWKEITHVKQTGAIASNVDKFMDVVEGAKENKGCILVQFPASVTPVHFEHVEKILQTIHNRNKSNNWSLCVEFRHSGWYGNKEVLELLYKLEIALVLHDMPKSKTPLQNLEWNVLYFRFHGPSGNYDGSYSNEFLNEYSELIFEALMNGKDVYAYFNNTIGQAFQNAQYLKEKVLLTMPQLHSNHEI